MGWDNPPVPWREFERRLSWRQGKRSGAGPGGDGAASEDDGTGPDGDIAVAGGAGAGGTGGKPVPWAELHCHSSYSFLDGASAPRDLIKEAARLGLTAIAITDHDGMYGVPQFAQNATRLKESADGTAGGPATVFGAELSLDIPPLRRRTGSSSAGRPGVRVRTGPRYGS